MHSEAIRARLLVAQRHVASGHRIVERQRDLVDRLHRLGFNTVPAVELLRTFEGIQAHFVADCARLRGELEAAETVRSKRGR